MTAQEHERGTLPPLHTLTERQRYGLHCVHCGTQLAPDSAVELGIRYSGDGTARTAWYPRACRRCCAQRATPDIDTMRATAQRLLDPAADLPTTDEVDTLILAYRGMLMELIPAVEDAANRRPDGDVTRSDAEAGLREARVRLEYGPRSSALPALVAHGQRLARAVVCLTRHLGWLEAAADGAQGARS
ncbi:DUF6415 family natural product biosynthesis protein [Streptomyces sp. TRM49041]|uniref:DUF6415 family natural product biosynthesis protein n=1 Tax=Streptomyces sp. TRM49041 TaxID=2603216 RepID=UPI001CA3B69E|nr:DUF6415 family natural product biosynthesis protein [Streptomyces sp. TRM49041]